MPQTEPFRRPAGPALVITAVLALGGCAALSDSWPFARKDVRTGSQIAVLEHDPTVWCYRTIGQPDCYATEQRQYASRLLGAFIRTGGELVPALPSSKATADAPTAAASAPTPTVAN
jgi:hypothetical protein